MRTPQHPRHDEPSKRLSRLPSLLVFFAACWLVYFPGRLRAQSDDGGGNPTDAAGSFNGEVTTGGSYDPFTGNARRAITDATVPGSVGAFPLAFSRIANSRLSTRPGYDNFFGDGGNWRHSYQWSMSYLGKDSNNVDTYLVDYPDGRAVKFKTGRNTSPDNRLHGPAGVRDSLVVNVDPTIQPAQGASTANAAVLYLGDGSSVTFDYTPHYNVPLPASNYFQVRRLTDPNGSNYYFSYEGGNLTQIIDSSYRRLYFTYNTITYGNRQWFVLGKVRAVVGAGQDVVVSDVGYTYDLFGTQGDGSPYLVLTHVFYYYEPSVDNPGNGHVVTATCSYVAGTEGGRPLIYASEEPHFAGPMARLRYNFDHGNVGAWGTVLTETHDVPTNPYSENVSTLDRSDPIHPRETRGDGPQRGFAYGAANDDQGVPTAAKGYQLSSFTDFQNATSYKYYYNSTDPGQVAIHGRGYLAATKDRRGLRTDYDVEPYVGAVRQVTFPAEPDGTRASRQFVYTDNTHTDPSTPYYVFQTTDERGCVTTYRRDHPAALVTKVVHPDGVTEDFSYKTYTTVINNLDGHTSNVPTNFYRLLTHTITNYNPNTGTNQTSQTTYNYDESGHGSSGLWGQLTSIVHPIGSDDGTMAPPVNLYYDSFDRLVRVSDERGNNTWIGDTNGQGGYNGRHQVLRVTNADNSFVLNTYDDYGNATSVRDELGHVTTTFYDDYRRPYYVQVPVNQAAGSYRVTQVDYNRFGIAGSAYQHTTGNFGQTILPSGRAVDMIYFDNWWPAERIDGYGSADQNATFFGYDQVGHQTAVNQQVNGNAYRQTNSDYDARGRLAHTYEPNGATTTYGYDHAGNLIRVDLPADPATRTVLYADPGNPNDPANVRNYDAMNQRRWTQDPKGQQVSAEYAGVGRLTKLTDANGYTTFNYDLLGRPKKTNYLDGTNEQWTYDEGGNLRTFQNRGGTIQTMRAYDNRNRLTGWDWNDGATASCGFGYDPANRMTFAENWHSHDEFTYNDAGEVIAELQNVGYRGALTVNYDRDSAGRVVGMRHPAGGYFRFGYTGREQLATVSLDGPGTLATYYYYADGLRYWTSLLNGSVNRTYPFDAAGRLTEQHHAHYNGSGYDNIAFRQYGWSPTDKLSWLKHYDSCTPGSDAEDGRGNAYFYDGADQLQTAYLDGIGVAGTVDGNGNSYAVYPANNDYRRLGDYRYDAAGNRTYVNRDNANVVSYGYNTVNQINGSGYDVRGNLNYFPGGASGDGTWNYTYNAQNQLRTVSGSDANGTAHGATLYYDALGRLIARYLDNTNAYLYYDLAGNVIEERDDTLNYRYTFVHGPGSDELVCRIGSGPTLWYHQDVMGDVIAVTGDAGNVLERYAYDNYGTPRVRDAAGNYRAGNASLYGNRILHKGRDWWGEVGLYDYRARAYSPALGRFLQPDPAGFGASGTNLYAFCGNDPVNNSDPSGLDYDFNDGFYTGFNTTDYSGAIDFGSYGFGPSNSFGVSVTFTPTVGSAPNGGSKPYVPGNPMQGASKPYPVYSPTSSGSTNPSFVQNINKFVGSITPGNSSYQYGLYNLYQGNYGRAATGFGSMIAEDVMFAASFGTTTLASASTKGSVELVHITDTAGAAGLRTATPQLGRKLEYFLGNATGTAHNIERSTGMLRQLQSIGLQDTPATRQYLSEHLGSVLNSASNIVRTQANGTVVRESVLMGPNGGMKLETVWDGSKLITGKLLGGN